PPTHLRQERITPGPRGDEVAARRQPAANGVDGTDARTGTLQPDGGTLRAQADAERRTAGRQGLDVARVAHLGRVRQVERLQEPRRQARLQPAQLGPGERLAADAVTAPLLVVGVLVAGE